MPLSKDQGPYVGGLANGGGITVYLHQMSHRTSPIQIQHGALSNDLLLSSALGLLAALHAVDQPLLG